MEITEVKVYPVEKNESKVERLKAFASVIFDNCFIVRDLRIINGSKGLFVAMPSRKKKDGTYKDMAHPINSETRTKIESAILKEYYRQLGLPEDSGPATDKEQ